MGAFDYEKSKEEKVADTTRNERTSKNTVYLSEYGKYTTASRGFIANVLNRPVYTYTKLREDIFYIHCRLFTENNSLNYIFIVNEKSFWKRFTVFNSTHENSDCQCFTLSFFILFTYRGTTSLHQFPKLCSVLLSPEAQTVRP